MSTGCRQKEFPGPSLNGENERLDFKNNFQRWNFSFMKKGHYNYLIKKITLFSRQHALLILKSIAQEPLKKMKKCFLLTSLKF